MFVFVTFQLLNLQGLSVYWNPYLPDTSLVRNKLPSEDARMSPQAWRVSQCIMLRRNNCMQGHNLHLDVVIPESAEECYRQPQDHGRGVRIQYVNAFAV